MEEPGGQHPMGSQRVRHGSATNTHTRHPKKPPRALLCKLCQALKTVWALGPAAAVLVPGQTSPRATKYKDTEGPGLKIAAGTPSGEDYEQQDTKRALPRRRSKGGSCAWSLRSAPRGWGGRPPKPPSSLPPRSPHLRGRPTLLREHPGHLLLVVAPLRCRAPSGDMPGFLSGLLSTSRTRVQGPGREHSPRTQNKP